MAADIATLLDEAGVEYELIPHPRTETAQAEAEALGLDPTEVAKTLVLKVPDGYARAVVPAANRVDLHKVRELLGVSGKQIHLASEEDLTRDYSDFELGAVPPFGGSGSDRVIVDSRVAERDSVVLEAGSHEQSVRMQTADLVRLAGAEIADISQE